jgi:hypothetical protein
VNSDPIGERDMDRRELDAWLMAEEGGDEEAADAAFAHVFSAVPKVEPRPMFVDHVVSATWAWRARRRRQLALRWTTAAVLVVVAAASAFLASAVLTGTVVKVVAFVSGHVVPWLVAYASVALHGWLTLGHVGAVIAGTLMTPGRVAALVGVELVGILAFYALWRVAGAERLGDVQV